MVFIYNTKTWYWNFFGIFFRLANFGKVPLLLLFSVLPCNTLKEATRFTYTRLKIIYFKKGVKKHRPLVLCYKNSSTRHYNNNKISLSLHRNRHVNLHDELLNDFPLCMLT